MIQSQDPYSGGFPNREPGPHPWNLCPIFVGQARNKLSMTVRDLREPRSRDIFLRLIKKSDVFIENNQPETLDKLNIGVGVLREANPNLIIVRLSAFGLTGPWSEYRTHGQQLDAISGHLSLRGYPDMGPGGASDMPVADYTGAAYGALAAMMALYYRRRTGKPQIIDIGQAETLPMCLGEAMMDYFMNDRIHENIGNRDIHGAAPCGCYRCLGEDEWVNITVANQGEWERFKEVLEYPAWANEVRFATPHNRYQNQNELDKLVGEWTIQHEKNAVMQMLQNAGVAAGPVMNSRDSYEDPHLRDRHFFEQLSHEDAGTHWYPGMPYKLSKTPLSIKQPPIKLGEHNEYVYTKVLGFSDKEYEEMVAEGEAATEPALHIQ
jgi:crotonobetainyl-CoA:carnitine CoA-transferase CaiB-like acyl-CoA transferase